MTKKAPKKTKKKHEPQRKAEYQEFIRFTALPRVLRKKEYGYHTDDKFCDAFKINQWTLVQWKKKDEFWEEVQKTWRIWGRSRTPDIILALYRTAKKEGKAPEAKFWAQWIENWKEKSEVDTNLTKPTLQAIQSGIREIIDGEKKPKAKK